MGSGPFWFLIVLTLILVIVFVAFIIQVVNDLEFSAARDPTRMALPPSRSESMRGWH